MSPPLLRRLLRAQRAVDRYVRTCNAERSACERPYLRRHFYSPAALVQRRLD